MLRWFKDNFLRTPSSFEGSPVKWLLNQLGHWLVVGTFPTYLFGPLIIPIIVAAYAYWEWTQYKKYGAESWDCFQDWVFVSCGALCVVAPIVSIPLLGFLVTGYLRRT